MSDYYPSAYIHDKPKARKEHICCECHGTIFKGEKYHRHHGIWGTEALTYKNCEECEQLRSRININQARIEPEDRICFSELEMYVFELRELEYMQAFLNTKLKRNAKIFPWMDDEIDELLNEKDAKDEAANSINQ